MVSITSCSAYRPPLRKAIHAFKYGGMWILCDPLVDLLKTTLQTQRLPSNGLVPVPLHKARIRERGYNQSALLASRLGKRLDIPVWEDALVRIRNTPAQVGLTREQRHYNMAGAFQSRRTFQGQDILLIDDVCTTGATLEACASEVLLSGARSVRALTLARALCRRSATP